MRNRDGVLSESLALVGIFLIVLVAVACAPTPAAEVGDLPSPTPPAGAGDLPSPTPPAAVESPLATGTPPSLTVVPGGPQTTDQVAPKGEEDTMFQSPTSPTPADPSLQTMVAEAAKDLAQRLSIVGDQIELLEIKAVVWSDGSLGCAQPGVAYTQVPVDGTLIRLRVGNEIYNYHSGGPKGPFLCEQKWEPLSWPAKHPLVSERREPQWPCSGSRPRLAVPAKKLVTRASAAAQHGEACLEGSRRESRLGAQEILSLLLRNKPVILNEVKNLCWA